MNATLEVLGRHSSCHRQEIEATDEWQTIPKDMLGAIKLIFRLEVEGAHCSDDIRILSRCCTDALKHKLKHSDVGTILFEPPFYIGTDNWTKKEFIGKKRQFARFQGHDLDPLQRFWIAEDDFDRVRGIIEADRSFELTYRSEGFMEGNAFEAIVASHAVHAEACYHCKMRESLRWCGGSSNSWKDLKCMKCGSCFEIKSKASKEKVDRQFSFGTVHGGSFRRWCQDEQSLRQGRDYIVLIGWARTTLRTGSIVWMVEIAEIKSILPRIDFSAFITKESEPISVRSTIHIAIPTRQLWFTIPCPSFFLDLKELFKTVFDEIYPGQFDRISENQNFEGSEGVHANARDTIQTRSTGNSSKNEPSFGLIPATADRTSRTS